MSGRTKRILYNAVSAVGVAATLAGLLLMWFLGGVPKKDVCLVAVAAALYLVLPPNLLIHEGGHIAVGLCAGMKFASVRVGHLVFSREKGKLSCKFLLSSGTAGESAFYPRSHGKMRLRLALATAAGAAFNLIYGTVFLVLFLCLPYSSALTFFALFAPLNFYEGIMALYPAELDEGKTDGAVLLGLMKKAPDEEVALRVFEAEGILYRGTFADVPRELLFDAPAVREDLPAFHALLFLRMRAHLFAGEREEAQAVLARIRSLEEYLDEEGEAALFRYKAYFEGKFEPDPYALLFGVRELEKSLVENK